MSEGLSPRCPSCDHLISTEQINIEEGFAVCSYCHKLYRLNDLNFSNVSSKEALEDPPSGCCYERQGQSVMLKASTRSLTGFFGMLAISLFWNGIVSIFVLFAISGLYHNLIGPVPEWFPAPEMNDDEMGLGSTLFLCAFLTPFVLIGTTMVITMFTYLYGHVEVYIDKYQSYAASCIWFLKWKRRFNLDEVTAVRIGKSFWQSNDQHVPLLEIVCDRNVQFGSNLSEKRRDWLYMALRQFLLNKNSIHR